MERINDKVASMTVTTVDAEWTTQPGPKGRVDGAPYNNKNFLVSIGLKNLAAKTVLYFNLGNRTAPRVDNPSLAVQTILDDTTLLVAHNMKADLSWLREAGFTYEKGLWCTMVAEYIMAKGQKVPLDLTSCCLRRGVPGKNDTKIREYLDQGVGYEDIPWPLVEEYGTQDVLSAEGLYLKQRELLGTFIGKVKR